MNGRRVKRWLSALVIVGLSVGLAACGSSAQHDDPRPEEERNYEPQELNSTVFLDAEQFEEYADDGATILDTRSQEDYEEGHFPGAVQVDGGKPWKDDSGYLIAREDDDGQLVGDVVEAQQLVRDLGIDNDRPVIIYGDARNSETGRLFWTLEYYGHGDVYLYRDSYEHLQDNLDFEAETGANEPDEGDFILAFRDSVFATDADVEAATDEGDAVILDTRREAEWDGTEDRGDPRQGRIPESVWYYWENIFNEDDRLHDRGELKEEFTDEGIYDEDALIIPFCQTGTRSSYIYAVLRWLGKDDAKNYDGSWVEWSRDEDLPVEEPQDE
ncbi:MAG: sulfurtransferase [Persicimonas sp.]